MGIPLTAAARGAPRHDQQRDGWGLRRQRSIQGVCSVDEHQKLQRRGERRATINEELWGGSTFESDSLANQSTPRSTHTSYSVS